MTSINPRCARLCACVRKGEPSLDTAATHLALLDRPERKQPVAFRARRQDLVGEGHMQRGRRSDGCRTLF